MPDPCGRLYAWEQREPPTSAAPTIDYKALAAEVATALADIVFSAKPAGIKGRPRILFQSRSVPTAERVDCRNYNALHIDVFVAGTTPSATLTIKGSNEEGGNYLPLADAQAVQRVTASMSFDVMAGSAWASVELSGISGTFTGGQGYTVFVTPYVAAGPAELAITSVRAAPLRLGFNTWLTLTCTLADTDYSGAVPAWANSVVILANNACIVSFDADTSNTAGAGVGVPVGASVDRVIPLTRSGGDGEIHVQSATAGTVVLVGFVA